MQRGQDLHLLTKSSLELARTKLQTGEFDTASSIIKQLMTLIYDRRGEESHSDVLADCFSALGDIYRSERQLNQALTAYEEALALISKANGETSKQSMSVLFRIERTLGEISKSARTKQTLSAVRWRAKLLAGGIHKPGDIENKESIPVQRLNSLWEDALKKNQEQLDQKEQEQLKRTFEEVKKRESHETPWAKFYDTLGHISIRFVPIAVLCVVVAIFFKSFGGIKGGVGAAVQSPDYRYLLAQPVDPAVQNTLHGIAQGTNKTFSSGDDSQQLKFEPGHPGQWTSNGETLSLPYLIEDGTALSRASLCVHTLMHRRNLLLIPNLYGLEDESGNVYFDTGSSEYRLASQMRELAQHLNVPDLEDFKDKLQESKYDDPFTGSQEKIVSMQVQAASAQEALRDVSRRLSANEPGTVFCLLVDTGKSTEKIICGLDRERALIPFGNRDQLFFPVSAAAAAATPPVMASRVDGIIVLPVPSKLAHNYGLLVCGVCVLLFVSLGMLFRRPVIRWTCYAVGLLSGITAVVAMVAR